MKLNIKSKKLISVSIAGAMILSMSLPYNVIKAEEVTKPEMAEYTEEFKQYREDLKNGNAEKYGGIAPPSQKIEAAPVEGDAYKLERFSSVKYDPRELGKSTPAKDQGGLGLCWDFAAISGMEAYLMTNGYGEYDLSEEHMRWWSKYGANGWNIGDDDGGYNAVSMAYFVSGEGPKYESDIPYDEFSYDIPSNQKTAKETDYTADDIIYIPNDMKSMKNAISKYGGVVSSYYDDEYYYGEDENSYFSNEFEMPNHSVAIVGWDDNYNDFTGPVKPTKKGAWLIKNSWGDYNDEDGFMWISYQDASLKTVEDNYVIKSVRKNNNEKVYKHENGGFSAMVSNGDSYANVFNFNGTNETLEGVTLGLKTTNTKYDLYYADVKNGVPQKNGMKKLSSGVIRDSGYTTIQLNSVSIPSGKGAIVAKLTPQNDGEGTLLACESTDDTDESFTAKISKGESFLLEGGKFVDMKLSYGSPVNFSIKAITKSNINPNDIIGSNRYETAVKTSQKGWSSADTAVIANGGAIVDALTATPLASHENAPVLLTEKNSLKDVTRNELKRLGVKNVYLIGGSSVLSGNVEGQLRDMGISVKRLSGSDRYRTGIAIANELENTGADINEAAVVNGVTGLADAISFGAAAGERNIPILLSDKRGNIPGADDILNDVDKTYIIGGTAAVPQSVENYTVNPERISGKNRSDTNAKIINKFYPSSNYSYAYVVKDGSNGTDQLIDGLSVGALAAKTKSPIVLAGKSMSASQREILSSKRINTVVQVGGGQNSVVANELRK